MTTGQSQQLIQKLLKAEEEAEALIEKSQREPCAQAPRGQAGRRRRNGHLQAQEEKKFQTEQSAVTGGADGDATSLEAQTLTDLKRVQSDFNGNKDKITEYMVEKILTVKPELSQIQVALLQAATA